MRVGVDVEALASLDVDLLLHSLPLSLEPLLEGAKPVDVDRDARPFHIRQHVDEWHLDVAEERGHPRRLQLRLEHLTQLPRDVGVLARVVTCHLDRHNVERKLGLPLTAQRLIRRHRVLQELEGQYVEPVRPPSGVEHITRQHGVELDAPNRHPGAAQHQNVELGVLPRLGDGRILEQGAEVGERLGQQRREVLHRHHAPRDRACGDAIAIRPTLRRLASLSRL